LENILNRSGIDMSIIVVHGNNTHHTRQELQFAWCEETFGKFRERWNYDIVKDVYGFHHESDAVLFRLKWD
jgi:hypothetical protein